MKPTTSVQWDTCWKGGTGNGGLKKNAHILGIHWDDIWVKAEFSRQTFEAEETVHAKAY